MIRTVSRVLALLLVAVSPACAQQITRDSLYDFADAYWRLRMTVAAPSGDSLAITCEEAGNFWQASVRLYAAVPWSPDALSTSTSNIFGFSSSNTTSRLVMMWPDGKRDRWSITFLSGRGVNWIGPATSDAAAATRNAGAAGLRAGWLSTGDEFLLQLAKHGKVGITYPTADWVRSFELVFADEQRAAFKAMYDRCSKKREGAPARSASE